LPLASKSNTCQTASFIARLLFFVETQHPIPLTDEFLTMISNHQLNEPSEKGRKIVTGTFLDAWTLLTVASLPHDRSSSDVLTIIINHFGGPHDSVWKDPLLKDYLVLAQAKVIASDKPHQIDEIISHIDMYVSRLAHRGSANRYEMIDRILSILDINWTQDGTPSRLSLRSIKSNDLRGYFYKLIITASRLLNHIARGISIVKRVDITIRLIYASLQLLEGTSQQYLLYWRLKMIFDPNGPYRTLISHMDDISPETNMRLTTIDLLLANSSRQCDTNATDGEYGTRSNRYQRHNNWLLLSRTLGIVNDHQSQKNHNDAWIAARRYQRVYNHFQLNPKINNVRSSHPIPTSLLNELLQQRMDADVPPTVMSYDRHEFDFECITCDKLGIFEPSGETSSTNEWQHCRRCKFAWACSYLCRQTHYASSCNGTLINDNTHHRTSMISMMTYDGPFIDLTELLPPLWIQRTQSESNID
jgi:hypothetical protein